VGAGSTPAEIHCSANKRSIRWTISALVERVFSRDFETETGCRSKSAPCAARSETAVQKAHRLEVTERKRQKVIAGLELERKRTVTAGRLQYIEVRPRWTNISGFFASCPRRNLWVTTLRAVRRGGPRRGLVFLKKAKGRSPNGPQVATIHHYEQSRDGNLAKVSGRRIARPLGVERASTMVLTV
jgi:hypothetical protein